MLLKQRATLASASFADIVEDLLVKYEDKLPLGTVSQVVLQARSQLSGQTPNAALPELVYRLAYARLDHLVSPIHDQ